MRTLLRYWIHSCSVVSSKGRLLVGGKTCASNAEAPPKLPKLSMVEPNVAGISTADPGACKYVATPVTGRLWPGAAVDNGAGAKADAVPAAPEVSAAAATAEPARVPSAPMLVPKRGDPPDCVVAGADDRTAMGDTDAKDRGAPTRALPAALVRLAGWVSGGVVGADVCAGSNGAMDAPTLDVSS